MKKSRSPRRDSALGQRGGGVVNVGQRSGIPGQYVISPESKCDNHERCYVCMRDGDLNWQI